mgnify:CR=1 FL=1
MKYALLQMPDESIKIVDNNTHIGKGLVCKLIDEGGKSVGIIESDLTSGALKVGLEHYCTAKMDKLYQRISLALKALYGDITYDDIKEEVNPCKQHQN